MEDDGPPCQELGQQSAPLQVFHVPDSEKQHVGKLSLFEHRLVCNNSIGVMYAGGHISALNFHPSYKSLCALAAHRHDRPKHDILKCYKGRAHIQLWTLSLQPGDTHFLGVIPHNGNCTWDLKWRPDTFQTSSSSIGTLAAALGDGTAIVATFEDFDLPDFSSVPDKASCKSIFTLRPKIMTLRAQKKAHQRRPVRVAEWSPDGTRLVLGIADGSIEVYEASSNEKVWPRWCLPAQESVITGVRWMNSSYLCSVSISCVLSVRDIRNPISSLEQNAESLAGSMAMEAVESDVAVVGTDSGTLRVVKLSAIEGAYVKQPVKRIYLQTNTVRDIQAVSEIGSDTVIPYTLLYAGGSEGIVHECILPRPIWPNPDTCHLPRTETQQKLRWKLGPSNALHDEPSPCLDEISPHPDSTKPSISSTNQPVNTDLVLDLCVGDDYKGSDELASHSRDSTAIGDDACPTDLKVKKRSRAAGRDYMERTGNTSKTVLFGPELEQRTTITRIGLSQKDDLIAVGIDDGIVTWTTMKGNEKRTPFFQKLKSPGLTSKLKKLKSPGKKRGRPRKHPLADVIIMDETEHVKSKNSGPGDEDTEDADNVLEIKASEGQSPMPMVKILGRRPKHDQKASLEESEKDGPSFSTGTTECDTQKRKRKKGERESQTKRKVRRLSTNERVNGLNEGGGNIIEINRMSNENDGYNLGNNCENVLISKMKIEDPTGRNKRKGKRSESTSIKASKTKSDAVINESAKHKKMSRTKNASKRSDLARTPVGKDGEEVYKDKPVLLRLQLKAVTPKKNRVVGRDNLKRIRKPKSNKMSSITLKLRLKPAKPSGEGIDHDLRSDLMISGSYFKNANREKEIDKNAKAEISLDGTLKEAAKGSEELKNSKVVWLRLPLKRKQDERHDENISTLSSASSYAQKRALKDNAICAEDGDKTSAHKRIRVDEKEETKIRDIPVETNDTKVVDQPIANGTDANEEANKEPGKKGPSSANDDNQKHTKDSQPLQPPSKTKTNETKTEKTMSLYSLQGEDRESSNPMTHNILGGVEINNPTPKMDITDEENLVPNLKDAQLEHIDGLEDTEQCKKRPSRTRKPSWRLRQ